MTSVYLRSLMFVSRYMNMLRLAPITASSVEGHNELAVLGVLSCELAKGEFPQNFFTYKFIQDDISPRNRSIGGGRNGLAFLGVFWCKLASLGDLPHVTFCPYRFIQADFPPNRGCRMAG